VQRNFGTISMFGFSVILMASWEAILSTAALGLTNGGSAGFLYTCLATWLGFIAVYASLGEMGSMAPTSGRYAYSFHLCSACLIALQVVSFIG
jgi:choline transport protein